MVREKPKDISWYPWSRFEDYADRYGIGEHPEDWMPWYECWKDGYETAKLEVTNV